MFATVLFKEATEFAGPITFHVDLKLIHNVTANSERVYGRITETDLYTKDYASKSAMLDDSHRGRLTVK